MEDKEVNDIEQQLVAETSSNDAIATSPGADQSPTTIETTRPTTQDEPSVLIANSNSRDEEVSRLPTWWSDSISATPSWKTKPTPTSAAATPVEGKHDDDQHVIKTSKETRTMDLAALTNDDDDHDIEAANLQDTTPLATKVEKLSMSVDATNGAEGNSSVPLTPPLPPSHVPKGSRAVAEPGYGREMHAISTPTPTTEASIDEILSKVESTSGKSSRVKVLQAPSVSFADSEIGTQNLLDASEAMKEAPAKPADGATGSVNSSLENNVRQPPKHSKSLHSPTVNKQQPTTGAGESMALSASSPNIAPTTAPGSGSRLRIYKSSNSTNVKWVTREIAALDFLLGIPMEAEQEIVHQGWMQQHGLLQSTKNSRAIDGGGRQEEKMEILEPPAVSGNIAVPSSSSHGRWWEKWISNTTPSDGNSKYPQGQEEEEELEQPNEVSDSNQAATVSTRQQPHVSIVHAPGRRLEGDQASLVQVPLGDDNVVTRQRSIARQAAIREWELRVAHGIGSAKKLSQESQTPRQSPHQSTIGGPGNNAKPMLDGRMFFSASGSYPMGVYSLIRYEPKKEQAIRMRKRLEALGGGGTQFFAMPERDWRGISYRALLISYDGDNDKDNDDSSTDNLDSNKKRRRRTKKESFSPTSSTSALSPDPKMFDRFATSSMSMGTSVTASNSNNSKDNSGDENEDNGSVASISSDEHDVDDTYTAGLLDDPDMVQGRHRTVMIGDRVTGCIVSSTIQFVKPSILKADLNKKFRDKFDGWEPPKSQHKFIGAKVVDGVYTLMEPQDDDGGGSASGKDTGAAEHAVRMPSSLTLSKIRSIKQQALMAAVKAKLELGTVALAFIYFERLCLDCRVDKTNRRLSFAACLLLAIKINESHVGLVMKAEPSKQNSPKNSSSDDKKGPLRLQTLIRLTKKSDNMFASLLEFFTEDWSLSLKHLFAAEWGVFAALQFRLHAKPSQVAFHFKRLIKSMGWDPLSYLGSEMFGYWQESLALEDYRSIARARRQEIRQQRKNKEKLDHLKRELHAATFRLKKENDDENDDSTSRLLAAIGSDVGAEINPQPTGSALVPNFATFGSPVRPQRAATRLATAMNRKILRGFGMKKVMSTDRLAVSSLHNPNPPRSSISQPGSPSDHYGSRTPFMPAIAGSRSLPDDEDDRNNGDANSNDAIRIAIDSDGVDQAVADAGDVEEGIII